MQKKSKNIHAKKNHIKPQTGVFVERWPSLADLALLCDSQNNIKKKTNGSHFEILIVVGNRGIKIC